MKTYIIVLLSIALCGYATWNPKVRTKIGGRRVLENKTLRIFEQKKGKVR
jgi:hypothetical protein